MKPYKASSKRLYKNLDAVVNKMERSAVRKVLRLATQPLESEMKLLVRKRSGDLMRSIETQIKVKRKDSYNVKVGPLGEHGWKGHLIEGGHKIGKSSKRVQAYPFIRPAWDARRHQVTQSIGVGIGTIVKGSIK